VPDPVPVCVDPDRPSDDGVDRERDEELAVRQVDQADTLRVEPIESPRRPCRVGARARARSCPLPAAPGSGGRGPPGLPVEVRGAAMGRRSRSRLQPNQGPVRRAPCPQTPSTTAAAKPLLDSRSHSPYPSYGGVDLRGGRPRHKGSPPAATARGRRGCSITPSRTKIAVSRASGLRSATNRSNLTRLASRASFTDHRAGFHHRPGWRRTRSS
jgi:hypothetical protein